MQCTVALFCLLLLSSTTAAQQEYGNIANLLGEEEGVNVLWGIPDSTAVLGKAFHFTLPDNAFSGNVEHVKVTEAGSDVLPPWLHYDSPTRTLSGVPFPDDANRQIYIEVTVKGEGSDGAPVEAKDIFAITIAKEDIRSDAISLKDANADLKPITCPPASSVTKATIVIDAENLSAEQRWWLVHAMSDHLGLPANVLRLRPMDNVPFLDSSALVAGPGDVKESQHSPVGIEWEVGCGNVQAVHMPILTSVEASSSDGEMRKAVGHGIVGWYVTNHKAQTPKRLKRQALHATATPEVSFGLPTDRPVATVTLTSDMPTSRSVPTMASPSFTDIEPSSSSSHSKHKPHRSKTTGRHLHKTKHPKHSPTPLQTPTASTAMPIMPTPVSAIMPSSMEPSLTPVMPIMNPSSPGLSPSYLPPPVMTPSFSSSSFSSLSSSSTPTDILPSTSSTPLFESTTDDIIVTSPTLMPSTEAPPIITASSPTPQPPTPPIGKFNFPPLVKQYLRPYKITEGDILDFPIPEDTFNDYEDGNSRNLKLLLLTIDGLSVPPISWIQLNDTSQTLYGLPREFDIGKHEYLLAAIDSDGKLARLVFEMIVERRPRQSNINHEFSMTLDMNFKVFLLGVDQQIQVAKNLAKLYGDPDTRMISIIRFEEGSVRYIWTNNSLPTDSCPIREITGLLSYLITIDNTLNPKLTQAMAPTEVLGAGVESRGKCEGTAFENTAGGEVRKPEAKNGVGEEEGRTAVVEEVVVVEGEPRETSDEDVMITTVIPAVVIAAMLLLAGLIACILYRKKRKGKLSDEDQHTFINKGIPIIFADELEERHDQPTKPLILANEKPPLPPPDYPRSASGSVLSTPRSDHKEPLIQDPFSTDDEGEMSPYHPPPPVTGSLGRSRTPINQPAFRSPPPYVPP